MKHSLTNNEPPLTLLSTKQAISENFHKTHGKQPL